MLRALVGGLRHRVRSVANKVRTRLRLISSAKREGDVSVGFLLTADAIRDGARPAFARAGGRDSSPDRFRAPVGIGPARRPAVPDRYSRTPEDALQLPTARGQCHLVVITTRGIIIWRHQEPGT